MINFDFIVKVNSHRAKEKANTLFDLCRLYL